MLKNKTAVITGASSGAGLAAAEIFLKQGAQVVINGRNEEKLQKALSLLQPYGEVIAAAGDVSREKNVLDIVEKTLETYGKIDILVNNAGIPLVKKMTDTTVDEWNHVFGVISTGTFLMTREAVKHMIEKKIYGRIVNISSVSGKSGNALATAYSAAKAAVIGFSRALAKEIASYKITVNCILPGAIDTPMFREGSIGAISKMFSVPEETLKKSTLQVIPLGRLLDPAEVAHLAAFLSSDNAAGITGQAYVISCGYEIG